LYYLHHRLCGAFHCDTTTREGLLPFGDALSMQTWWIRIRGEPRKEVNAELLIQAVIALGEQLRAEAATPQQPNQKGE
jgi:hypothetical protein